MTRLTFGVTSSPFLTCQTLHQLAEDRSSAFPQASRVVCNSFYVDDCLSGANSVEEAIHLRNQLNDLLTEGNMTLRKWRASSEVVMNSIPKELREQGDVLPPVSVTKLWAFIGT